MPSAEVATSGLSSEAAARLLVEVGPNTLPQQARPSVWRLLASQLTHFFALLLWGAALLAVIAGMPALGVAIALVVLINGVFAFVQEHRADRAADRLRQLMPADTMVLRDGRRTAVPALSLVPGDVVLLEGGDRVSADLRVSVAHGLTVDESMLTGESVPARRRADDLLSAGTYVLEGATEAVVVATGGNTRLAGIAAATAAARRPLGPLALRLHRLVRVLALLAIGVGVLFLGVALLLGMSPVEAFLIAIGVTVALVPEGLLPTVTLALAWGAHRMADRHALVRHLEAVETLGSVTMICTDKTGTLTRNEMSVIDVWTPAGTAQVTGVGYEPAGAVVGAAAATTAAAEVAYAATRASTGRLVRHGEQWQRSGDPMEVALHVFALRAGIDIAAREAAEPVRAVYPFDPRRRCYSVVVGDELLIKGAPEAVFARCATTPDPQAVDAAADFANRGFRVLAVAQRSSPELGGGADADEQQLVLLGLVALADPPRPDVTEAIAACRRAEIKIAVVTGDHPRTAAAIAAQVGICGPDALVLTGDELPADEDALGALLDRDGVVVARVSPQDKLRIAGALQRRGHVVAMTGDGVNDAPALRQADVGVAMGASGSDVAREAADLVLLDDHFGTIVTAVELGRATFANVRRFLTYHLTDNVAELAPFLLWGLTGGTFPLAIGVLQVLALDIGTDLLPALALGAEPPSPRALRGPAPAGQFLNRTVLTRAFGVLGPTEVLASLGAFTVVLLAGGWHWSQTPSAPLLATASGAAFAAIVLGQLGNAFACRSGSHPAWRLPLGGNRLLIGAVLTELVVLIGFLYLPPLAKLLGGAPPTALGWLLAALAGPLVLLTDAVFKATLGRRFTSAGDGPAAADPPGSPRWQR